MILRDSEVTKVFIVTLAETTPVLEAQALQEDLRQAGIEPFAWVVNQALTNQTLRDPVLRSRQREQQAYLHEVAAQHSRRMATVSWQFKPPIGVAALRRLSEDRSHVVAPR